MLVMGILFPDMKTNCVTVLGNLSILSSILRIDVVLKFPYGYMDIVSIESLFT